MTDVPSTRKTNRLGLDVSSYRGSKTTLCAGCGHNAISERIIDAFFEMGVDPRQVVKLSGIGCSSKSPAYFLGAAHGFSPADRRRAATVGAGSTGCRRAPRIGVIQHDPRPVTVDGQRNRLESRAAPQKSGPSSSTV